MVRTATATKQAATSRPGLKRANTAKNCKETWSRLTVLWKTSSSLRSRDKNCLGRSKFGSAYSGSETDSTGLITRFQSTLTGPRESRMDRAGNHAGACGLGTPTVFLFRRLLTGMTYHVNSTHSCPTASFARDFPS